MSTAGKKNKPISDRALVGSRLPSQQGLPALFATVVQPNPYSSRTSQPDALPAPRASPLAHCGKTAAVTLDPTPAHRQPGTPALTSLPSPKQPQERRGPPFLPEAAPGRPLLSSLLTLQALPFLLTAFKIPGLHLLFTCSRLGFLHFRQRFLKCTYCLQGLAISASGLPPFPQPSVAWFAFPTSTASLPNPWATSVLPHH